jgi:cytochrome c
MWPRLTALILIAVSAAPAAWTATPAPLGLGQPASPAEIAGWDIDVRADGAGLPPGRGSVDQGRTLYATACAGCHGLAGAGGPMDALVGGRGSLATAKPVRTVGSYWPYATTLFDFIRRAMPFDAPQSLTPDQVYALCAYLLSLNGIVPANTVLDAATLPRVRMPNRDGFTGPNGESKGGVLGGGSAPGW